MSNHLRHKFWKSAFIGLDDSVIREFKQNIGFKNFTRMASVMIAAVIAGTCFFIFRLFLYKGYSDVPGYTLYIYLNGIVAVGSAILLYCFRKTSPEKPDDINLSHLALVYLSAFFCMLLLSVSAGVEYITAGTFSRFLFAIFGACVVITINWYVLLGFYLISTVSVIVTIDFLGGNIGELAITHLHIPVVMLITWMLSRIFFFSAFRDFHIQKEMETTNRNLQVEIKGRLETMEALKLSEIRFRALFESAPDAYVLYDIKSDSVVEVNRYAENLVKLTNEEVAGKSYRELRFLNPTQKALVNEIIQEAVVHKFAGPYEFDLILADDSNVIVELRLAFATLKGRDTIIGIARDITDRKTAEENLRKSHEELEQRVKERTAKLEEANELLRQEIAEHTRTENVLRKTEEQSRVLIEKLNDGFAVFDDEMVITYANDRLCEMLGRPWTSIVGRGIYDFAVESESDTIPRILVEERGSYELALRAEAGNIINTIISPEPLYSESGMLEGSFSVITDITKIKLMEEALRESEEISRAILDASNDSVMMLKPDGTVLASNEMAGLTLDVDPGKLRGKNVFDYLPKDGNEFRKRRLIDATASGDPVIYEDNFGASYYAFHIYPIQDGGDNIERVAIFARDITELKNAEKHIHILSQELIKVQEGERQRISRDLHDNVAQELASIKIGCDTLFDQYPDLPRDITRKVSGFSRILQNSIMSIRDLAYDLRPPGLDQLGLVSTISRYCDDYSDRNLIRVDFYSAGVSELELNFDTEINLYRIVQEAMNNIHKHAEASHVTIRLTASFPTIILRIEDDGKGFDVKKRRKESLIEKRMGVRSMEERAALLQGKADINSIAGQGTKIVVEIPLEENVQNTVEEQEVR